MKYLKLNLYKYEYNLYLYAQLAGIILLIILLIVPVLKSEPETCQAPNRKRRSLNGDPLNLYIEYLVVVDSSTYAKYQRLYGQLSDELVMQYLKIHFSQLTNAVFFFSLGQNYLILY